MRKYIYPLLAILVLPFIMASCSSDDEDEVLSENCYISSFSLGTLKRTVYALSSEGEDSLYTTSFVGSYFPMTINQRTLTIENLDSLPIRTKLDRVLVSVVFEGSMGWRKANITNLTDTAWTTYSTSDSIDMTEPLHFCVIPETGHGERIYTVKVNVHQQKGDSTTWNSIGKTDALSGIGERKTLIWNDKFVVLGVNDSGELTCIQHPCATSGEWTTETATGAANAQPSTLQQQGSMLLMSTTDGGILESADGINWTTSAYPIKSGLQLVAASSDFLYALCDGNLYRSNGGEWTEEKLDDDRENLPTTEINSVFYTLNSQMPRLVLIGSRGDADTHAIVWAKSWVTGNETDESWIYYTPNNADKYLCPLFDGLCIVPYDGGLQALGGKSRDGQYNALDVILHSRDHGISWKDYEDDDMNVDPDLQTAAQAASHISAAVDDDNFLWVLVDDALWRGRINRLGFQKQDYYE